MADEKKVLILYGRLKDKFGDNGLISIIIAKIKDKELFKKTFQKQLG